MKLDKPVISRNHPICSEGYSGTQKIWRFENGYGASVINFKLFNGMYGSYTNDDNEFELAVIKFKGKSNEKFEIDYNTPITNDVIGNLSIEEVIKILKKIKELE